MLISFSRIAWSIQFISWPQLSVYSAVRLHVFSTVIASFTSRTRTMMSSGFWKIVVRMVWNSRWVSWTGILLLSVWTWSLRPPQIITIHPWSLLSMTRVVFGWRVCSVLHVLGNFPFLHDLLGIVLSLGYFYLIHLWCLIFRLLLGYHLGCYFPRLVGPSPFLESFLFLSNQGWTHTLFLVLHGT